MSINTVIISKVGVILKGLEDIKHYKVPLKDIETLRGEHYDNVIVIINDENDANTLIQTNTLDFPRIIYASVHDLMLCVTSIINGERKLSIYPCEDKNHMIEWIRSLII